MNYDVVIIGAGPGGIAAAHNLINNNISCILIDKQKFPRNKLCAGGITYKTFELMKTLKLNNDFNIENSIVSEGARLYMEYKHIADIKTKGFTYLVNRFEFDDYLVEEFKKKGGVFLEGVGVESIDTKGNVITLSNEDKIEFKYVIGADGAVGITRKLVDDKYNANRFCLQVEIDKDKFNYEGNYMSLYYGIIPQGYGWIFPKQNSYTVGFGGDYDKKIDFHEEFERFLNNLGIDCNRKEFKGAMLPFGKYIKNPINKEKNLLLVGDAAGFVDPFTGEGIYFAMLSGIKSSKVIMSALKTNDKKAIDKYKDEIAEITKNIGKGAKFKKLVYKFRNPIFNAMKNEKFGSYIFNECLYESNYNLLDIVFHRK